MGLSQVVSPLPEKCSDTLSSSTYYDVARARQSMVPLARLEDIDVRAVGPFPRFSDDVLEAYQMQVFRSQRLRCLVLHTAFLLLELNAQIVYSIHERNDVSIYLV